MLRDTAETLLSTLLFGWCTCVHWQFFQTQSEQYFRRTVVENIEHDTDQRNFTAVCSVTWPLKGSETGRDLVLRQTSLLC